MATAPGSYWESRLSKEFDLHGVGYQGLGRRFNEWLYRVRRHVFHRVVGSLPVDLATAKVADIGSGTGFYIERWFEAGAVDVTGVDITEVSVRNLGERFPKATFVQADIGEEQVPFAPATFDLVSAFDVLFHIVDDERYVRAVKNVHDMLKPGGYFVLSDHLTHEPVKRTAVEAIRPLADVEAAARAAGLEIVRRQPTFVLMNSPVDSTNRFRWLAWRIMVGPAHFGEFLGNIVGAVLYPFDLVLSRIKKESASTEVMILRRPT